MRKGVKYPHPIPLNTIHKNKKLMISSLVLHSYIKPDSSNMNNLIDPPNEGEIKEENLLNMSPPEKEKEKDPIDALIEAITKQKVRGTTEYHFRPVCIDGVYCYIVLYFKYNMLTVESINIKCKFNCNGADIMLPYVLYHHTFSSIKLVVLRVQKIYSSYRVMNGDLVTQTDYDDMKLEESILPYSVNEICCVCLENTTDTTSCGHFICFACRDKCCIQKKMNCPMCRTPNVLPVYHNVMNLINNTDHQELCDIFKDKYLPSILEPDPEFESDSDSDSESEAESNMDADEIHSSIREVDSIS